MQSARPVPRETATGKTADSIDKFFAIDCQSLLVILFVMIAFWFLYFLPVHLGPLGLLADWLAILLAGRLSGWLVGLLARWLLDLLAGMLAY